LSPLSGPTPASAQAFSPNVGLAIGELWLPSLPVEEPILASVAARRRADKRSGARAEPAQCAPNAGERIDPA